MDVISSCSQNHIPDERLHSLNSLDSLTLGPVNMSNYNEISSWYLYIQSCMLYVCSHRKYLLSTSLLFIYIANHVLYCLSAFSVHFENHLIVGIISLVMILVLACLRLVTPSSTLLSEKL